MQKIDQCIIIISAGLSVIILYQFANMMRGVFKKGGGLNIQMPGIFDKKKFQKL